MVSSAPDGSGRQDPEHRDVVALTMPLNRSQAASFAKGRQRPTGPHCRGGASSLLRLANPAAARLPKATDLSDWISRAAGLLGATASARPAFAASEFSR
jgi:hypothetical protein